MAKFELNILGCGSATPTPRHQPSCQVLNVRDNLFMIDCGEGAQLQMQKMRLKFSRLGHIFISHLHGDHVFGLPGLVSTLGLTLKEGGITIHIFQEGAEQIKSILDYFCNGMPFEVRYNIIGRTNDIIYENDYMTVRTIPLYHRVPAVGFLFKEKPKPRHINGEMARFHQVPHYAMKTLAAGADFVKPDGTVIPNALLTTDPDHSTSYAYCSDTMYDERVAQHIHGVDWLYHEATYSSEVGKQAAERGHSTAAEAARIAVMAGAKQLILGHFSKKYDDEQPLLDEARAIFPCSHLADEGRVFKLL